MARKILLAPGELYHIYNRGTDRREIYSSARDYERFVALLYLCNDKGRLHMADLIPRGETSWNLEDLLAIERGEILAEIAAYCLMPNHFHLILKEREAGGISRFMQKLTTAYTMYFNKRHARTGALFESVFKSAHANEDRYLKYLIAYIHLNPIKLIDPKWKETGIADKARAKKYLEDYAYSSYLDYAGRARAQEKILAKNALPNYFETPKDFSSAMTEWLSFHEVSPRG